MVLNQGPKSRIVGDHPQFLGHLLLGTLVDRNLRKHVLLGTVLDNYSPHPNLLGTTCLAPYLQIRVGA